MRSKFFYWLPRVLTILSILFMALFSLDSFGGNGSVWKKMLVFLMHNIPVLILTVILIIAWKREVAGGILLILVSLAGCIFFHSFTGNPGSIIVITPFFLEGLLFVLHGTVNKKNGAMVER
ncbi:MAG TPA: hypothetical protein VFE71_07160 [Bacteroidales bacterium]|nr:hypothetical protein [Bacteroidales bacterium]